LQMAVFERGDIELVLQHTGIDVLVASVQDNIGPLAEKYRAIVDIDGKGAPVARLDRTHMANVLYNLIENGMKYTRPDHQPHVQVSYGANNDGSVWLSVTDNGVGIAPAYQKQIFENFF